jgi:anti-sigma factor RsiW
MKSCEEYEIELSSLLDGEAAPEAAAAAIEHALTCASCGAFFLAARRLAEPARALAATENGLSRERAETLWLEIRRLSAPAGVRSAGGAWARGLRAAALVAVGLGGGYLWSTLGAAGSLAAEGAVGGFVTAAVRSGASMDERRFVELADELMRADPRYQRAMLEILRLVPALEIGEGFGPEEGRPIVRARADLDTREGQL